jgi:hypothetical protein
MLFMVIERFKTGKTADVQARFRAAGRMLPPDVTYLDSWIDPRGPACFQLMEAPNVEALSSWIIDFEVVPVVRSAEFWETRD